MGQESNNVPLAPLALDKKFLDGLKIRTKSYERVPELLNKTVDK